MSELRHDPITDRWVVISSERARRPSSKNSAGPKVCPLCAGHENMTPPEIFAILENGSDRKDFRGDDFGKWLIRDIPNKFPFLGLEATDKRLGRRVVSGFFDQMHGYGAHELIIECPGPDHLEIADCASAADILRIEGIFWLFCERIRDLSLNKLLQFFLIFKNYKPEAGASLAHPHCQLTAMPIVPVEVARELRVSEVYYEEKHRCLMCDVINVELEFGKRIVTESENFVVLCPFASRFPGELLIAPKTDNHAHLFHNSSDELLRELAKVFTQTLKKVKAFFEDPPYNYVLHSAPVAFNNRHSGETIEEDYHWHFHILPRWTKIAGFEIGAGLFINELAPEQAAEYLRNVQI